MPKYKINEIFYSLKGEGRWSGTPMKFIRLQGCNLKCAFCDTPDRLWKEMSIDEILQELNKFPKEAKRVVITGGEPCIQPIEALKEALWEEGYLIHLETNGIEPIPGMFDWIALSPKNEDVDTLNITQADEIKFLVGEPGWEHLIDYYDPYIHPKTLRLVMAIAKGRREDDFTKGSTDLIQDNVKLAMEYAMKHPRYSLCLQIHKYLNIQ